MKKQINKWMAAYFVLLSAFSSYATAQERGEVSDEFQGEGTELQPYLIRSAADLRKLADDVEKGMTYREEFFQLANDIVLNDGVLDAEGNLNKERSKGFEEWKPIGTEKTHFCGTFDGAHYSIYGLYINKNEKTPKGLFAYLSGTVKNLAIKDSYLCCNADMGSIAGKAETITINNNAYIPNISYCLNYATIETWQSSSCGGICGSMDDGRISKCTNFGHISGYIYEGDGRRSIRLGGIVGYYVIHYKTNRTCDIYDCCNMGLLECTYGGDCGGITGHFFDVNMPGAGGTLSFNIMKNHIYNCVNYATIKSSCMSGGIVGHGDWCAVDGCVNYGVIQGTDGYVGAIAAGSGACFVKNCAFLETSCYTFFPEDVLSYYSEIDAGNNKAMTKKEMKQQSFLDELNANAQRLGKDYSLWKFGSDGFPTLAWIDDEITDEISDILVTNKTERIDNTKNIFNMSGQLIRANSVDSDGLPQGIYIIGGKKVIITKQNK